MPALCWLLPCCPPMAPLSKEDRRSLSCLDSFPAYPSFDPTGPVPRPSPLFLRPVPSPVTCFSRPLGLLLSSAIFPSFHLLHLVPYDCVFVSVSVITAFSFRRSVKAVYFVFIKIHLTDEIFIFLVITPICACITYHFLLPGLLRQPDFRKCLLPGSPPSPPPLQRRRNRFPARIRPLLPERHLLHQGS